ncbi:hypothetical protein FOMPIDRAFT_1019869 [Fomitopsis schrenkii]|uniref:Uncharacterized protein n=1 Tax=Fomitopsis schrenkii TaxID=2126942 RepID=S8EYV3_FOMSC|nr:hypothetical protein FOMPIDRAFT_1019869 [Fomitopsis schrenkii]
MSSLVLPRSQPSIAFTSSSQLLPRDERSLPPSPRIRHAPHHRPTNSLLYAPASSCLDVTPTPTGLLWGLAGKGSPTQRSSSVSLRLASSTDANPSGRNLPPRLPKDRNLLINLSGSLSDLPDLSAPGLPEIPAVSRNPSSMSLRRLASNRPTLQRKVDMPPVPIFPSASRLAVTPIISPLPLSLCQFSLAYSKTRTSRASPVTPIDQIMPTTPLSPPPMPVTATSLSKFKLRNPLPSIRLRRADYTPDYPQGSSPVSPLGMPSPLFSGDPLSAKPIPLAPSCSLFSSASSAAPTTHTGATLEQDRVASQALLKTVQSSVNSCRPPPQIILRPRAPPPLRLSLPRRLSYNRSGFTSSSGGGTPSPLRPELASPVVIGSQPGSGPPGLPKSLRLVQDVGTPGTPNVHADQPKMVELGSYF